LRSSTSQMRRIGTLFTTSFSTSTFSSGRFCVRRVEPPVSVARQGLAAVARLARGGVTVLLVVLRVIRHSQAEGGAARRDTGRACGAPADRVEARCLLGDRQVAAQRGTALAEVAGELPQAATAPDHPVRVLGRVDLPLRRLRRRHAEIWACRRLAVVHLDAVHLERDAGDVAWARSRGRF
jgi:hypothetical protein